MDSPENDAPILVFLHGVGTGDRDDKWMTQLSQSLTKIGYPEANATQVIAPKYAHALKGWDYKVALPDVTVKQPVREAARQNRREFERRTGAVEFRLGRHDRGVGWPGGEFVIGGASKLSPFKQAHNYVNDPQIRAQVLTHILKALPETGRVVIVGHSLGSVIAADLIRRLPHGLHVEGLITIGSPLANGSFDVDKVRENLKEPPTNLAWWVNFWNRFDPVAAHRGVSSVFPWMIDFPVQTPPSLHVHDAVEYLANEGVAEAIGFALFGSRSKELVPVERGLDIPLDEAELYSLLALRYAYLIRSRLEGDLRDRFTGALRQVQATVVEGLKSRNKMENRPIPSAVARLSFDLSDPHSIVPEPHPTGYLTKDDAVVPLTVLASENIIRPFDIGVPRDKRQAALQDLTAEMGLGGQYGTDVFTAAKRAQSALAAGRGINWIKWGALSVGAVALVVGTGGLALAAAPGLAGAAAITTALAAFGPGGMIGGLLTAGSLVTAGGGGVAFGLANSGTTAETLEAVISRQLAATILRQLQHLEQTDEVWRLLAETEIQVRREHERLDEFSDESASALKELRRKIEAVERSLEYLKANGLEPEIGYE